MSGSFIHFLLEYWGWIVGGLIVVVGLGLVGLSDVSRFSISRAWAISGVCFAESIRKKVLLLTPLAIAGIIIISQLQRALDEQDAIRQTIKFCLFASGMLVVLSSLILSCTNLPKEIESRVIFTIVTKPTTRLEIIVGKVIGFARVSGAILVIMGLFTWTYLYVRERGQMKQIATRIQDGGVSETEKARLVHYSQSGLLSARHLWSADQLQVVGEKPDFSTDKRTIHGDGEEDVLVGFPVTKDMFPRIDPQTGAADAQSGVGQTGLVIRIDMNWKRTGPIADSLDPDQAVAKPIILGPAAPTTEPAIPPRPPGVSIDLADRNLFSFITGPQMVGGTTQGNLIAHILDWNNAKDHKQSWVGVKVRLHPENEKGYAYVWVPPTEAAEKLYGHRIFYVRITGANQNVTYEVGNEPVQVFVPHLPTGPEDQFVLDQTPAIEVNRLKDDQGVITPLIFRGRLGIHGEQDLEGGSTSPMAAAIYSFRKTPSPETSDGQIPFEMSALQIQRSNEGDTDETHEDPTNLSITFHDILSGHDTSVNLNVETRLTTFFTVPASAITGPDYDVIVQCSNKGHTVGFYAESLQLVMGRQSFVRNLVKSLSIIWMMSILVIILSVLCSTFVSWPIAIVMTVILLLGHWGVNQLSDVSGPGLGRLFINDFKIGDKDAPVAKVVSSVIDELSGSVNALAKVLPDTEQFDAIGDIEEGITVSPAKLWEGLKILLGFGIPAIVLAYWRLKWVEVAP